MEGVFCSTEKCAETPVCQGGSRGGAMSPVGSVTERGAGELQGSRESLL